MKTHKTCRSEKDRGLLENTSYELCVFQLQCDESARKRANRDNSSDWLCVVIYCVAVFSLSAFCELYTSVDLELNDTAFFDSSVFMPPSAHTFEVCMWFARRFLYSCSMWMAHLSEAENTPP